MSSGSLGNSALSRIFSKWQRFLGALIVLLAVEAALAAVIRVRVLSDTITGAEGISFHSALSSLGLLLFPLMLFAIVRIRTAQKELHLLVSNEQESLNTIRTLLDTAAEGIYALDANGLCTMANRAAGEFLGYGPQELIGRNMHEVIHHSRADGSPYPAHECPIYEAISIGETRTMDDEVFWRKDGTSFSTAYSSAPIVISDEVIGAVVSFSDITDRKKIQASLEQAKEEADRANHAKSEFLSRMSHELRTPLNAILGFAQLLDLDELSPEQRDSVNEIAKGGSHLLDLINEVLDLSRIEAGRLDLVTATIDVVDIARETTALLRPMAEENGITLSIQAGAVPDEAMIVFSDKQRLKQVLMNLISNGIKYNVAGGHVEISFQHQDGDIEISVRDTGPGIGQADLDKVFAPFERLGAEATVVEGTGLGLAVTRRLVEAMNGSLAVSSVLGEGSTFIVQLPAGMSPARRHALEEVEASDRFRILYIEDNRSDVKLLQGALTHDNAVQFEATGQGLVGLDLARSLQPNVIFLDLQLPDVDGSEIFKSLREDSATSSIPIVIVSGEYRESELVTFADRGAKAFLRKPIDVREVLALLRELRDARK